jgi:hypothetical protein
VAVLVIFADTATQKFPLRLKTYLKYSQELGSTPVFSVAIPKKRSRASVAVERENAGLNLKLNHIFPLLPDTIQNQPLAITVYELMLLPVL